MTPAAAVREALSQVADPELPVLSVEDLGIVRDVTVDGRSVTVTITPTYSGCPAMEAIGADIVTALRARGWEQVTVRTVRTPPWTTDWISEDGRRKLLDHGIAPPTGTVAGPVLVPLSRRRVLACPQCGSPDTEELTRFGSTACQALWRCRSCREPFGHVKDH